MYAQESPALGKIRDVSSDKIFALRISCSSEPADADNIDLDLITAAELVSLPSKNNEEQRQVSNHVKEKAPSNE
jgi:hypothetical protein